MVAFWLVLEGKAKDNDHFRGLLFSKSTLVYLHMHLGLPFLTEPSLEQDGPILFSGHRHFLDWGLDADPSRPRHVSGSSNICFPPIGGVGVRSKRDTNHQTIGPHANLRLT